jgi:hypothetical protein
MENQFAITKLASSMKNLSSDEENQETSIINKNGVPSDEAEIHNMAKDVNVMSSLSGSSNNPQGAELSDDPGEMETERMLREMGFVIKYEDDYYYETIEDPGEVGIAKILQEIGLHQPGKKEKKSRKDVPSNNDVLKMMKDVDLMVEAEKKAVKPTRNKLSKFMPSSKGSLLR